MMAKAELRSSLRGLFMRTAPRLRTPRCSVVLVIRSGAGDDGEGLRRADDRG